MKTLVAWFSHRGMNYVAGKMVDLKVGNTEVAAKLAAELSGAGLFEIRTVQDYPFTTASASKSLSANWRKTRGLSWPCSRPSWTA